MRLEIHYSELIVCITAFIIMWLFTRNKHANRSFRVGTSIIAAAIMPAFILVHGEVVMVLPTASLFTILNQFSWGAGLFYLIVNFIVFSKFFGSFSRKKAI